MTRKIIKTVLFLLLLLFLTFLFFSPKKTKPFTDQKGNHLENSIAQIYEVNINGIEQRLLIRGKNKNNPVLLHLHGGPGSPDHPFMKRDHSVLEDLFTVCYWEHRGSGASYSKNISSESMTINQIVEDGLEVVKYLKNMFPHDKLYLQGHSWGTVIGVHMVSEKPNWFHAYFGIGQIVDMSISDGLSYDFALHEAKKFENEKDIEILNKIGRPPYSSPEVWTQSVISQRQIMRPYQNKYINRSENLWDIYAAFIFYKEYSIKDKLSAMRGDPYSMWHLWPEVIEIDFSKSHQKFEIPIYFFHGRHDQTTNLQLVENYYSSISAPQKEIYIFEQSAHSPQLEEFDAYRTIIQSILKKR